MDADDLGCEEIDRLSEHSSFCLDASDTPADDSKTVDHRGVGIGADQAVWVINATGCILGMENAAGQILEIHLVDDADTGRNNSKGLKSPLAPF